MFEHLFEPLLFRCLQILLTNHLEVEFHIHRKTIFHTPHKDQNIQLNRLMENAISHHHHQYHLR